MRHISYFDSKKYLSTFRFLSKTCTSKRLYRHTKIINNNSILHQEQFAQHQEMKGTDAREWKRESKILKSSCLIPKYLQSYTLSKCATWIFYIYLNVLHVNLKAIYIFKEITKTWKIKILAPYITSLPM